MRRELQTWSAYPFHSYLSRVHRFRVCCPASHQCTELNSSHNILKLSIFHHGQQLHQLCQSVIRGFISKRFFVPTQGYPPKAALPCAFRDNVDLLNISRIFFLAGGTYSRSHLAIISTSSCDILLLILAESCKLVVVSSSGHLFANPWDPVQHI